MLVLDLHQINTNDIGPHNLHKVKNKKINVINSCGNYDGKNAEEKKVNAI